MTKIDFLEISACEQPLIFSVIAARCQGKWIYCRHKARTTWELPGGHIEPGETAAQAAARELFEETGAVQFDLQPVCVYQVTTEQSVTCGMLYFAEVTALGAIPAASEMAEIGFYDAPPENQTYPAIQPVLFERTLLYLYEQKTGNELWDVLDEKRNPTGRTARRGDAPLPAGDYHLVVHVWIQNSRGELLLTRRTKNKTFPLLWEVTGGSAVSGDDSLHAALREVREETGFQLDPNCGRLICSEKRKDNFLDIWLFRAELDLHNAVLQPFETCDIRWVSLHELLEMRTKGTVAPLACFEQVLNALEET